jgi:hypothetical protein
MRKKCSDLQKRGIASPYWSEILDVIKWLEDLEEYEKELNDEKIK